MAGLFVTLRSTLAKSRLTGFAILAENSLHRAIFPVLEGDFHFEKVYIPSDHFKACMAKQTLQSEHITAIKQELLCERNDGKYAGILSPP